MRPSVQKTLLVALGAALLSSALGVSGEGIGATAKVPPVRIVVLPGVPSSPAAATGDVGRLLNGARFARLLSELAATRAGQAGAAAGPSVAQARGSLVERVRQRLLAEARQNGR